VPEDRSVIEPESQFESPEVQRLFRHLKGDATAEFKPAFDLKTGQVSYPEAQTISSISPKEARRMLDFLAEKGILLKEPSEAFYTCPNCESRNLILIPGCPYCSSESLKSGRALEHFSCGYVDLEGAFLTKDGLKCPDCGKTLKAIGVDYRRTGTWYRCLTCEKLTEKPVQTFVCSNCKKRTPFVESMLTAAYSFRVNPDAGALIQKHALDLRPVIEVFEKHGFRTMTYAQVKGRSGVSHHADIAAWYLEIPETEEKPDLIVDVMILREALSQESMCAFMTKTVDVGSHVGIVVATPGISSLAGKLASYYSILNRGCDSVGEIPGVLAFLLGECLSKIAKRKLREVVTLAPPGGDRPSVRPQATKSVDLLPTPSELPGVGQGESQITLRKLLEYLEGHDASFDEALQRMKDEKAAKLK
jgi:uncharacterized protein YlaI